MPTPFMHLDFAERSLVHPNLDPAVHRLLANEWSPYYLGNIAADYQIICDIPRANTHSHGLPPEPGQQAHETMLACYPQLAAAERLPPAQAVFIAGYCFHLIQDLLWYRRVLEPFFFLADNWPPGQRVRFIAHNTLLTYLDQRAFQALPANAQSILAAATSEQWLPFAEDSEMHRWQDLISRQLHPGASTETIAIYAGRLKMTPTEFGQNLNDPAWMNEQVFSKVPLDRVEEVMENGIELAVKFINVYLAPAVSPH